MKPPFPSTAVSGHKNPLSWLDMQSWELGQFGLAGVERAKYGCAFHQGGRDMQNVQAAGANRWCLMFRQVLSFPKKLSPHGNSGHQNARRQVLLNPLPGGLTFCRGQSLLKYGEAHRVSKFQAMKPGELQRGRIFLTPSVGSGRVGVRDIQGDKNAGIGINLHQRSCSRASMTMLGKTLSPKIMRRRAA